MESIEVFKAALERRRQVGREMERAPKELRDRVIEVMGELMKLDPNYSSGKTERGALYDAAVDLAGSAARANIKEREQKEEEYGPCNACGDHTVYFHAWRDEDGWYYCEACVLAHEEREQKEVKV